MAQLTFGSLFAGIGGFDLGFERAGMVCKWQVEIDPFCQKVLAKHWPHVERFEDVKNVGKHNLQPVDVICGGFPCQPHSLAGKRRGAADDRNLWPEYRRIIAELRPAYIVGENVPGIRTTILDSVLLDLENLNYAWQSFIIPACAVDAPHRRDRVFIVAHTVGNHRWAEFTAGKRDKRQDDANGLQKRQEISSGLGASRETWTTANTESNGRQQGQQNGGGSVEGTGTGQKQRFGNGGGAMAYANGVNWRPGAGRQNGAKAGDKSWWSVEPAVGRVANGVPNRVDRLRSLGNAVVPQVAEFIGRLVVRHHLTKPFVPTQQASFLPQD